MFQSFVLIGELRDCETIAENLSIDELAGLKAKFGKGRRRKRKGRGRVELQDGSICDAELHWYEAHGIGKRKLKIKRLLT